MTGRDMTPEERARWDSFPSPEEQRAAIERAEARRLRRAIEANARALTARSSRPGRSGPARGRGLQRDRIVEAVAEAMAEGHDPTEEEIAEALDRDPRTLRRVGGTWAAILDDARRWTSG